MGDVDETAFGFCFRDLAAAGHRVFGKRRERAVVLRLRSFVGLWEGIDPVDSGNSLRSITCQRDQSCNLAATDSVITLCGSGPAFASGTGGLEGDGLVSPDAVLTCPDNSEEVHLSISYERDPLNRTLVETTVVVDTDTILPNIIFHKISR